MLILTSRFPIKTQKIFWLLNGSNTMLYAVISPGFVTKKEENQAQLRLIHHLHEQVAATTNLEEEKP